MEHVLVVDDDVELCELVAEYLEPEGFGVETSNDGREGLSKALSGDYAIVVLDVMLPEMNGFDVLRRLRAEAGGARGRIPVLMLTARGDDIDRIVGLELGADDYLAKPFNPRELVARIRAILRRTLQPERQVRGDAPPVVVLGDIRLDSGARTVRRAGDLVELTSAEFDLLQRLLQSPGAVVSREDLAQAALGRPLAPLDRSVDMHVSSLRRKLSAHPDGAERIKTIRGAGYLYTVISDE